MATPRSAEDSFDLGTDVVLSGKVSEAVIKRKEALKAKIKKFSMVRESDGESFCL